VFATDATATGLQRIFAAGGAITTLTKPDREHGESDHLWPEFLPGGHVVLFTITPSTGGIDNSQIAVLDLQSGVRLPSMRNVSRQWELPCQCSKM
jgi:hypothetical protein